MPLRYPHRPVFGGGFSPTQVAGLVAWYRASDGATIDSARSLSQLNDLSGNARHLVQSTGSAQPPLSRSDRVGNVITKSEEFDHANWVKTNVTVTADATTTYDGLTIADKILDTVAVGVAHSFNQPFSKGGFAKQYTASIEIKQAEKTLAFMCMTGSGTGDRAMVKIDLATGILSSTGTSGGFSGASSSVETLAGGWYRVHLTATTDASVTVVIRPFIATVAATDPFAADNQYTGLGGEGFYVCRAQLRESAWNSTYVTTTTRPIFACADNGQPYIYGDGSAYYMATAGFTFNGPWSFYYVERLISFTDTKRIMDGNGASSGSVRSTAPSPGLAPAGSSNGSATTDLALDVTGIISGCFNGAASWIRVNRGAKTTSDAGTSNPGGLTIMSVAGGSSCNRMRVHELIARSGVETDANFEKHIQYLAARYSITL